MTNVITWDRWKIITNRDQNYVRIGCEPLIWNPKDFKLRLNPLWNANGFRFGSRSRSGLATSIGGFITTTTISHRRRKNLTLERSLCIGDVNKVVLIAWPDADFAGDFIFTKSTSGFFQVVRKAKTRSFDDAALCSWLLTNGSTHFCPCKACPGNHRWIFRHLCEKQFENKCKCCCRRLFGSISVKSGFCGTAKIYLWLGLPQ